MPTYNQLNTEQFIKRAKTVHGEKYYYSKVNYINIDTPVEIICCIHGRFFQTPYKHLIGRGCGECGKNSSVNKRRTKTDDFIKRAKTVHGEKYDYSLTKYINSSTKVKIICKIHGIFEQLPQNHIRYGCNLCGNEKIKEKLRKPEEKFLEECKKIHRDNYDYSKVKYIKNSINVIVVCPIHGDFYVTPANHLKNKSGCPHCHVLSRGEETIKEILSENKIAFIPQKTFPDLKYKKSLRYDFYLNDRNSIIEYNGKQHYFETNFFSESLDVIKIKDEIKKKYCEEHNINLFVIRYDENIKDRLEEILNITSNQTSANLAESK